MGDVANEELARVVAEYSFAYLMTVTADGRPHAVAVQPRPAGDVLHVGELGNRSLSNAQERPCVSLVWPPVDIDGYSLIVDGEAQVDGGGLRLTPTRAVRHRPHGDGNGVTGCDSDCLPIDLDAG